MAEAPAEADAATLTYASDAARERLMAKFDSPLSDEQVAALAGAPDGSTVTVDKYGEIVVTRPDGSVSSVFINPGEDGPTLLNWRFIGPNGDPTVAVDPELLATQVRQAAELGIDNITTKSRVGSMDYAELPQLGYDASIEQVLTEARARDTLARLTLPPGVEGAQWLSEVLATPEGRAWWAEHGLNPSFVFDPTPGSKSWQQLDAYLQDHGLPGLDAGAPAEVAAAEPETTEQAQALLTTERQP
jgi:hypothetical protein